MASEMDEAIVKRILPHSIEAEQSVIGSMIMSRDAISVASSQARISIAVSMVYCLRPWWN